MKLRILFAALGLVLAIGGVVAVALYAAGADQRALNGQRPVDVLVVKQGVPAGTPVEALGEFLEIEAIPRRAVAVGAAATLEGLDGRVTSVDLVVGEQLLTSRLVAPDSLAVPDRVDVPAGLQEVSVQLGIDRAVGGVLVPGDTVGVVISYDSDSMDVTRLRLQKVLVTAVQELGAVAQEDVEDQAATKTVTGVLVTLAVNAPDAEVVVSAAEFGGIWLTREPLDANPDGTRILTPGGAVQ